MSDQRSIDAGEGYPNGEFAIGAGAEVYRLARSYEPAAAAAQIEQALGVPVIYIERDTQAASHAVFFAEVEDGDRCVLKVATLPSHDVALEVWAMERCRALDLPVPAVLFWDSEWREGGPPYLILERASGVSPHQTSLAPPARVELFQQLGRCAAAMHSISPEGFGKPMAVGPDYVGREPSLWAAVERAIEDVLAALPRDIFLDGEIERIRGRFWERRDLFTMGRAALVHGDYRFENILVEGAYVTAVLDFEMVTAGDPLMDLAGLMYSDTKSDEDLSAFLEGYHGVAPLQVEGESESRFLLYQILYALTDFWWMVEFRDVAGGRNALERVSSLGNRLDEIAS